MRMTFKGLEQVGKRFEKLANDLAFAQVVALTRTAGKIRDAEVQKMAQVFDRPTPYTLRSLQVTPARKTDAKPTASVGTKLGFSGVPAGRFLSPQVDGGDRAMKSTEKKLGSYVVPSRFEKTNAYGNMPGSRYMKILSQLGKLSDPQQNASGSRRSRAKRNAEAFFQQGNVIYSRKGKKILPSLILVGGRPQYRKRLPFHEVAQQVFDSEFEKQLRKAIADGFGL